ncbi:GNAT family N-acetyltransferase [Wenyingzhuangia aestuarii]|uniref:GNAT family N-acetyltransferase n=1 Tax=Wenyingzhuangia aestuarii TaxID=1647582 RepID=UPI00143C5790|nr:GNAT family N-acetyltransferase [Wenyingzhuangia aestuarii]NJB83307.1 diamine N-acetyltransferase [Wenyingzhuangia aestuarii]
MSKLTGNLIKLRALEPEDLEFLYHIENNEAYWEVSSTQTPYSRYLLKQYLENSHLDIYEAKQLRFAIENKQHNIVGMIDLFDFSPQHLRAGIGVLIDQTHQQKGYATEAIKLLNNYAFSSLNLRQLYANIATDNKNSIQLFEKLGYQNVGVRKDWIFSDGKFKDVAFYQLIHP